MDSWIHGFMDSWIRGFMDSSILAKHKNDHKHRTT